MNRGRRGGGGRRGGARRPPPPSREQLDKEIEVGSILVYILSISILQVYMSGTKSVLDKQLDDYRFPFLLHANFQVSIFGSRYSPFFGLQ